MSILYFHWDHFFWEQYCNRAQLYWPLHPECHIYVVFWTALVLAIFGHFLLLLELKTKFIKFWTKLSIKQVNFLPFRCTSLLLRTKPVQRNWLHFFKTLRALRINETKVTSKNAFIDNLFALESEKESKNDERTLFPDCPRILDLSVSPESVRLWMPHICGFLDCFSFGHFWPHPVAFKT